MDARLDQEQTSRFLGEYENAKDALNRAAVELRSLAIRSGDWAVASTAGRLIDELTKERICLGVLGNFKRGKSTFINAIIGSPVLPTGVVPLTSIITKMSYGMSSLITAHFKDGRCSSIGIVELADYITERGNPGNKKGVKEVEISIDSPYLRSGVVIVDTPGIGSTFGDNTRTTVEFLSRLDAAIIVIGSDPPVSREEIDFIRNVREFVRTIYIVQNKIDCLGESEWREALAFSQSVIENAIGTYINVYPLSSKMGLEAKLTGNKKGLEESGLPAFQSELERFIAVEKGRVLLSSFVAKMQRELSHLRARLDIELKVLRDEQERLDVKVNWLNSEIERVERRMDEIGYLIDGGIEQMVRSMDDKLALLKKENKRSIIDRLNEHIEKLDPKLGAAEFTQSVESFISTSVVQVYAAFLEREERAVSDTFTSLVRRYEGETNSIEEQLRSEVSSTFSFEFRNYPATSLNIGQSRFRFERAELLNYNSIIPAEMPYLLPKPLFRRMMKKRRWIWWKRNWISTGGR